MSRSLLLAILFFSFVINLTAQSGSNKLVFKANDRFDGSQLELWFSAQRLDGINLKQIFHQPDLYTLNIRDLNSLERLKNELSAFEGIDWVEMDQMIEQRYTPDDPYIDDQWHLQTISAYESWNIARGGLSPNGDTIVLAILDDGFFSSHKDLKENIWFNYGEIPNDGIDNDSNGYIDDFGGMNVLTGNDIHTVKEHGTAVAGIAGAKGDNGEGTVGVSLHVKLMLISEANSLSRVIEGYQYIRDLRKKYNETNGLSGAFVVATNLSAGINGVFPTDSPLYMEWCNVYDALGETGILNVNATTNTHVNIDEFGDMPGTCTSEYLVVVTNSNINDVKVNDAGYGSVSVDLAAPGEGILTTSLANEYSSFNGASSSAPQITGAIGLLYNADCQVFAQQTKSDPSVAALQVRDMLLMGVDELNAFDNLVTSGGRLNILNALSRLRDLCGGTTGELEIISIAPNPVHSRTKVYYQTQNYNLHTFELRNMLGQLIFKQDFYPFYFGDKVLELDVSQFALEHGVYIFSIRSEDQVRSSRILFQKS